MDYPAASTRVNNGVGCSGRQFTTSEITLIREVVNNSRLLLLPWIHIQNLASTMLERALKQLPADWQAQYGVTPVPVETFVDPTMYSGACYRAANWVELGQTSGRGRDDRQHSSHGAQPKQVLLYPLRRDALKRLREGSTRP